MAHAWRTQAAWAKIFYNNNVYFLYIIDAPETIDISGNTVVKHDDEKAVYTCSSSESFPEATIVWNKLVEGKLEKIDEIETEVTTEDTGAGVTKTSKFTLRPTRTHEEAFLLFCIVKIPDLKFERSSELLDVLITCK